MGRGEQSVQGVSAISPSVTSSLTLPHWAPSQLAESGLQVLMEGQVCAHPGGQDVPKGRNHS